MIRNPSSRGTKKNGSRHGYIFWALLNWAVGAQPEGEQVEPNNAGFGANSTGLIENRINLLRGSFECANHYACAEGAGAKLICGEHKSRENCRVCVHTSISPTPVLTFTLRYANNAIFFMQTFIWRADSPPKTHAV